MSLIALVLIFALMYYYMTMSKKGQIKVRTLPAMVAVPEAVGRAAEMGAPLFWTPGIGGGLNDSTQGPQILASISILEYVAEECVKAGVEIAAYCPLYAAGASISDDPDLLGSIKGEDIMKFIIIAVTAVGFLLGAVGMTFIADLLGM
jgi:hypothetical protein